MNLIALLTDTLQLLLILFGFGLVIVIHELGHFVAARWAGVRVLAFAVGFGKPLLSYRKGRGWRAGSTEKQDAANPDAPGAGNTEYRLNALPLGGYVKMLGQDDADPGHRSEAPDSYNSVAIWKRMVIISAGVVFNIVSAAALFMVVFLVGMRVPPPIIGEVASASPAALAEPITDGAGIGLEPGDRLLRINGERPQSFNDVAIGIAMSHPERGVNVLIEREGAGELAFNLKPRADQETGMLQIGVTSLISAQLIAPETEETLANFERLALAANAEGLRPGATLVTVEGEPAKSAHLIADIAARAPGEPIELTFEHENQLNSYVVPTSPVLLADAIPSPRGSFVQIGHIAGLRPVMRVGDLAPIDRGWEQGLRPGDVFALLGTVEFPSVEDGLKEIQSSRRGTVRAIVLRGDETVELDLSVNADGRVGFSTGQAERPYLAMPATNVVNGRTFEPLGDLPAEGVITRPGSLITAVDGVPISTWTEAIASLTNIARNTLAQSDSDSQTVNVPITLRLPLPLDDAGNPATETVELMLYRANLERLATLRWGTPEIEALFRPVMSTLRADSPVGAVRLGLHETRRVMISTYLTFVRLVQGSIQVERLSGPIGIVHIGTVFADRGIIWVLFFFALVSINLAVINFLPVPITDGGHMVFLIWEQITGKPVSILVQNIATLAGLALIGTLFLIVTYNDILRLFGLSS